jgi:hypothetical protein
MADESQIDAGHRGIRAFLRFIGPLMVLVGLSLVGVAMVSFFSAVGGGGPPRYFWCAFLGMPILGVGIAACKFAFMGAVARYAAGEVAPVARDTINYMADGTKDSIRTVAQAAAEGLRGGTNAPGPAQVRCHKCNALNDADAKFCDNCGAALAKSVQCPACGEFNDPDAGFCDNCGRAMR